MDFLNEKNDGSPQVYLGDFQTGEAFPDQGIEEQWIDSFNLIESNDFQGRQGYIKHNACHSYFYL